MSGYEVNKKQIDFRLGFISVIYLVGMAALSDMQSLWMDDIAQIQIASQSSVSLMIKENIRLDNNPPLFHLLSFFWIRIVPYGTGWLKLISIIFVAAGIFVCGVISYDISGTWAAIGTACLAASNTGIVTLAAYTFRPYGLLFFLSALMMLAYEKSRIQYSNRRNAGYLVIMLLAVYTHYFAVLVSIIFFMVDCYLVLKKRLKVYYLYVYLVAALGFLPWLLAVAHNSLRRIQSFWPEKPNLKMLVTMWQELNGNDHFYVYLLFSLTLIFIAGETYSWLKKKQSLDVFHIMVIVVPCTVIAAVYLLSRYVDSITSLFVSRYFICVMPQICIAGGIGMETALKLVLDRSKVLKLHRVIISLTGILLLFMLVRNELRVFLSNRGFSQPFRETADYLLNQEDVHQSQVLIFNTSNEVQTGWDYYLTHKNTRENVNVVWYQLTSEELEGICKVYLVELQLPLDQKVLEVLEENGFQKESEDDNLPVQIYVK